MSGIYLTLLVEEVLMVLLSLSLLLLSDKSLEGVRARNERVERGEDGADDKPGGRETEREMVRERV